MMKCGKKPGFMRACALHHMMQSGPKTLRTSSYDEVRKTQVFPSFFSALNHFVISSRAKGKAARTGHGPKRGPLVRRPQQASAPLSAVRVLRAQALRRDLSAQALGEKKLKFFPYPIPYEKGERPYAIPDLSGG